LLDNNQLVISSLYQTLKINPDINEDMIRHILLNTYRMYRTKFKNKYGEIVICHDGGKYWRKDIFSHYKANRKKSRDSSDLDWNDIHDIMNNLYQEVSETFPYKNIKIEKVEADDIIATLCEKYHIQENIVIVSSDKDFQQLQRYPNVQQYNPMKKEFIKCENPENFILEHIIKGDSSDGIPNILSDGDTFVIEDKRQKPCGKKKIGKIMESLDEYTSLENWNRNQQLIDFNFIPDEIQESILIEYDKEPIGERNNILNYFIDKRLKQLMEHIEEF